MTEWRKAIEKLEGAYSNSTLRGYEADMEQFVRWCERNHCDALPASLTTLVSYVNAEAARLRPSTIKRRLCGIGRIHRLLRHGDPTHDEDVQLALRRTRRKKPARPRQALGLTAGLRDRLLEACSADLIGLRDEILVRVGFDTLCRRSELVSLRADDLENNNRRKSFHLGAPRQERPNGPGSSGAAFVQDHGTASHIFEPNRIDHGPLLRPVYGERILSRYLEPVIVSRVLKKLAQKSGQSQKTRLGVSGHSLRVGAAQQLTLDGHGVLQIMRAGGWRSMTVVARYIENVDLDLWS